MNARSAAIDAFIAARGWGAARRRVIAGDASARRYQRLTRDDGTSAVLMDADPARNESTESFVRIAAHLRAHGLSPPDILAADTEHGLLLIEDLGERRFAEEMAADPASAPLLYRDAVAVLLHLRDMPLPALPVCDADWLTDTLDPFFDWYAPGADPGARTDFMAAFRPLAEAAARHDRVLMLRDFHAENLMLLPHRQGVARVGLLDFQDAMLAHPAYDLVSILQDARRDVPAPLEDAMCAGYLAASGEAPDAFRRDYAVLGLQRNLRILGVFARLDRRDGKPGYLAFVPRVRALVARNLTHPALEGAAAALRRVLPDLAQPLRETGDA